MRIRRLTAALLVATLGASFGVGIEQTAQAQKVANPGTFSLGLESANIAIKTTAFTLNKRLSPECSDGLDNEANSLVPGSTPTNPPVDTLIDWPADPECTSAADDSELIGGAQPKIDPALVGTVDAAGNLTVPTSGIIFPVVYIWEGTTLNSAITVRIQPTEPGVGTFNPFTGAVQARIKLRIKLEGGSGLTALGDSCIVGPIDMNVLTTGTTSPPLPNTPITGVPYNPDTHTATVVNNTFSVPGASGCGLLGAGNSILDDQLGLPSASGNNTAIMTGLLSPPYPIPAITTNVTTTPAQPITVQAETDPVTFDATGSSVVAGTPTYRLFPGDGSPAISQSTPVFNYTYPTDGSFVARLRVVDADGDFKEEEIPVTVTPRPPNVPPIADASADVTSGDAPLAVNFSSAGSVDPDGTITSYNWNFGNGAPASSDPNPTVTYSFGGNFTATLTVTDDRGGTATDNVPITVTTPVGNQDPEASFALSPDSGTTPLTVSLDASSSFDPDPDGTIEQYQWDFGDGHTDIDGGPNPAHVYTCSNVSCSYTPTLKVVDDNGATSALFTSPVPVVVTGDTPPVAAFTVTPASGTANTTAFAFNGSTSSDDQGIASYDWDFGDGYTATGATTTHVYGAQGTYTATLTATDTIGQTGSVTQTVTVNRETATVVNNTSFLESGTVSPDGSPATPVRTTFVVKHDAGTTIDGVKSDLDWNTTDNIAAAPVENATVLSTRPAGGFNYSTVQFTGSPGTYSFGDGLFCLGAGSTSNQTGRFRVVTSGGETATVTATVHLSRASTSCSSAPRAYLLSSSQTDTAVTTPGETTNFTFSPTDPRSNTITGYRWRWRRLNDNVAGTTSGDVTTINSDGTGGTFAADGPTLNLMNVTFPQRGRYVVEAQLRSSTATYADTSAWYRLGAVDVDYESPTASISAPASVVRGTPYTATVTTADADTTGRPQMIEWDVDGNSANGPLGDGFEERQYGQTEATPNLALSHVVQTTGAPTGANEIRVRVTDNGAMNGSDAIRRQVVATASVDVTNPPPVAGFVCNPCAGKTPLTVQFSAVGSGDDSAIADYAWDFGDGNTGSGAVATHTYASEGTYTPSLVVTDDEGATASHIGDPVTAGTPNVAPVAVANLTGPDHGPAPFTTSVSAVGSSDTDGTIVSYRWEWGDGTVPTYGETQSHEFLIPGTYTVTLTTKDNDGGLDQETLTVTADNVAPTASFEITPQTGVAQTTVFTFDGTASADPNVGDFLTAYEWDFDGDNVWDRTTAAPVTTWSYGLDGTYYPLMRVKDQRGAYSETTIRGTIVGAPDNQPPEASFTVSTPTPQKPAATVAVDASASVDPDFFGAIESYEWDFGDGTAHVGPSADPLATHTYTVPSGVYTITLTIVDNRGAQDTSTQTVTVLPPTPRTTPIRSIGGFVRIPSAVSGDAIVAFNLRSLTFFTATFWTGTVNYSDPAAGKDGRGIFLFKPSVNRSGQNGATATGVLDYTNVGGFKTGTMSFTIDDLSTLGEGADHVEVTGTGGNAALNFTNSGNATSGDVVVF